MSMQLDTQVAESGTRFRIFPQPPYLPSFKEPETTYVSVPVGKVETGPADDRMYVIDAIRKRPYSDFDGPPYLAPHNPPLQPGPDGHFDHLAPDSREFAAAAMYATVRRALDIWQDYFGNKIEWVFRANLDRLELIPLIDWDNAQSGWGFLEFGYGRLPTGGIDRSSPYCLNFDVLVHELVHNVLFTVVGSPTRATKTPYFGGFHEASADLGAIVVVLHSPKLVEVLLSECRGNLFTVNELDRLGDLRDNRQIRLALNYERMSTVGLEEHDLSLPLTGAMFDIFVEVFQKNLVKLGAITQSLADRSNHDYNQPGGGQEDDAQIQKEFDSAHATKPEEFRIALLEARDYLGALLASVWSKVSPHHMTYLDVANTVYDIDADLYGGQNLDTIRSCFSWREIALGADHVSQQVRRVLQSVCDPRGMSKDWV